MNQDRQYQRHRPRQRVLPALTAAALFLILSACGSNLKEESITASELAAHVGFLASDDNAGRLTGTHGVKNAEVYISRSFRADGLVRLPGEPGHFMDFSVFKYGFNPNATRLYLRAGERVVSATYGDQFIPLPNSGAGSVVGEVVFAGYGITAPEFGYDDYQGLDVKGKIALVLRYEPARFHTASEKAYTAHSYFENKLKNALAHGARAALFVAEPLFASENEKFFQAFPRYSLSPFTFVNGVFGDPRETERAPAPALRVSGQFLRGLFGGLGKTPDEIARALDGGVKPSAFRLKETYALISVSRHEPSREIPARNVAGFIPGSDPEKADQWIVIAAHHDHIGTRQGDGDSIFNGADDNASGTAGVLELAEAFARYSPPPRHSLLFVTFSAEEEGLLGSQAFLKDNPVPSGKIVFMCNLDMIGRNPGTPMEIIFRRQGSAHAEAVRRFTAAHHAPAAPKFEDEREAMSDDISFARRGIETFFFFSGLHPDYHGVDDEPDRLDYPVMETRLRFIYDFIVFLDGLSDR